MYPFTGKNLSRFVLLSTAMCLACSLGGVVGGCRASAAAQVAKPILTPVPEPAPQSTPALVTPAAGSTIVDPSTYVIGPEDVLQITVWKEQQLSGTFPVRPDGMISMVLLGDVKAAGLTPLQLADNLTKLYKKDILDPVVTVGVQGVNSQHIYMVGEIGHVGPVPLLPGMSMLQAISAAGGLTPYAHKTRIYILRGPQGKQQKIPFNYKKALRGDNQGVTLEPGDTVVVP
jgi:polysaccharide export outer membrane protein